MFICTNKEIICNSVLVDSARGVWVGDGVSSATVDGCVVVGY